MTGRCGRQGWKWSFRPDWVWPRVLCQGVWMLFPWNSEATSDFWLQNFVSDDLSNRDLENSSLCTEELLPYIKAFGDWQFGEGMQIPGSHQGARPLLVFCFSVLVKPAFILTVTSRSVMAAGLHPPCLHHGLEGGVKDKSGVHPRWVSQLLSAFSAVPHGPLFYIHWPNWISLPLLVSRKAKKCTLYSGQGCNWLKGRALLLRQKRIWVLEAAWAWSLLQKMIRTLPWHHLFSGSSWETMN